MKETKFLRLKIVGFTKEEIKAKLRTLQSMILCNLFVQEVKEIKMKYPFEECNKCPYKDVTDENCGTCIENKGE